MSVGVQYLQRGSIVTQNTEDNQSQTSDFYDQSRLHQVAFPMTLNARFMIEKFRFGASLGFRHLRTIGGHYERHLVRAQNNVTTFREDISGSFFDDTKFKAYNLTSGNQLSLGLSFPVKSAFEILTFFNFATKDIGLSIKRPGQIAGLDYRGDDHFTSGSDLQLMCRYYFN